MSLPGETRSDGYVNATMMCKRGVKEWANYMKNQATSQFIAKLDHPLETLIQYNHAGPYSTRGTWIHPSMRDHLAHWIASKPLRKKNSVMVYLVTAPHFKAVKIGRWSGSPDKLRMRYKTLLGKDIWMAWIHVANERAVEAETHVTFASTQIDGEVFEKQHIKGYIRYLKTKGTLHVWERECVELVA